LRRRFVITGTAIASHQHAGVGGGLKEGQVAKVNDRLQPGVVPQVSAQRLAEDSD